MKAAQGWGCTAATAKYRLFTDGKFVTNIKSATDNGVICGVYYFLTAATVKDAVEEANYFIKVITPYKSKIKLYAAVDVEDAPDPKYSRLPKNKEQLTAIINTFTDKVKAAGFIPAVYTNRDFLTSRINYSALKCKTIWRAHWYTKGEASYEQYAASSKPSDYSADMPMWQFGASTKVPGIRAKCDINWGYNLPGVTAAQESNADRVCAKCGFDARTRAYLDKYTYASDLWRKLWDAMK